MTRPLITLTSDFGIQTQGVGSMKAVALGICPDANVVHLMHGLPSFDIIAGSRTMETIAFLPVGFHVCVIDPGVGTSQKRIAIKTKRGDVLIGPDNGVLISAVKILGGFEKAVELKNPNYHKHPVSPIFHGRDIFTPAAAYLANGVQIEAFGDEISFENLAVAPYQEALIEENTIQAQIIQINKYGSLHLNILNQAWMEFNPGKKVVLDIHGHSVELAVVKTFGEVERGRELVLKDDYGRVEVAINMESFAEKYGVNIGDRCVVRKSTDSQPENYHHLS
jgi:S-adenosyl-L-methionine hydrolase (adenosine-forming)